MNRFSTQRQEEAQRHVDELAPLIRVADWDITVSDEFASPDVFAEIKWHSSHPSASIRLGADWWLQSDMEQCQHLVHELVHLWQATAWKAIEAVHEEDSLVRAVVEQAMEAQCERVARLVTPVLGCSHGRAVLATGGSDS